MKLLLTSEGLSNKSIADALQSLLGKPISETKLAIIPTASHMAGGSDKQWLMEGYVRLYNVGFQSIDFVDIAVLDDHVFMPKLEYADVIVVCGGKTSYLMEQMRKSGLSNEIHNLLKQRVYVGWSAGSICTGPDITQCGEYYSGEIEKENIIKGLHLVDFHIRPHYGRKDHNLMTKDRILESMKEGEKVYAIDDDSAVVVNGDDVQAVSEGKWELIEK